MLIKQLVGLTIMVNVDSIQIFSEAKLIKLVVEHKFRVSNQCPSNPLDVAINIYIRLVS